MALTDSTTTMACYFTVASGFLAILNLIRLWSPTVKTWVRENWKGFLRDEDNEKWPAIFSL